MLISGDHGSGKTALVTRLVDGFAMRFEDELRMPPVDSFDDSTLQECSSCIVAFHLCRPELSQHGKRNGVDDGDEVVRFVKSVSSMLASVLPQYASRLRSSEFARLSLTDVTPSNAVQSFRSGVLAPLKELRVSIDCKKVCVASFIFSLLLHNQTSRFHLREH